MLYLFKLVYLVLVLGFRYGVSVYNKVEVLSLLNKNFNGRLIFLYDWVMYLGLILVYIKLL